MGDLMTFFQKAVLSASPSHTSDFVLMVIEGGVSLLSFWRPGDLRWIRISGDPNTGYASHDVTYFNGHFYAVDSLARVVVCDVAGTEPTKSQIVAQLPLVHPDQFGQFYILESLGSLFVVSRHGVNIRPVKYDCERIPLTLLPEEGFLEEDLTYGTTDFHVFQIDLAAGKVTETRELGDMAFFLVANASHSVQASQFPGIKPNHIYFTDDYFITYINYKEGGGLDMGVFNLGDGSIQHHYDGVSLSRQSCPRFGEHCRLSITIPTEESGALRSTPSLDNWKHCFRSGVGQRMIESEDSLMFLGMRTLLVDPFRAELLQYMRNIN
ncbi:hypothetical protein RND71_029849 [Anisodus tanguticus]|uniref:KIB1-4 beta-propeller domain-containing protein n=1 Tax=Anisodus tanguticus TaxID=243964 RepID=A0AAE1REU5_9SOLA|nr:hypothetical protein RND71_029849 [Anisodus tanguticus]